MKIGSLFSGYGGLDAAVMDVLGGEVAWHCEWDAAPSKILKHHYPDIPNFRDVSLVDFTTVPPVDVLTGGFPCQDVSLAGRRAGMKDGTRSGLWSEYARAIDELKPSLVVIENVRGLLSAEADRNMEPDPWDMGNADSRPALRALGAVLGDLADLGYDAEWCGVRAADAGAPHGRFRVFVIAYPSGGGSGGWATESEPSRRDYAAVGSSARGAGAGPSVADAEHVIGYGTGRAWDGWPEPTGGPTAHAGRDEPERRGELRHLGSTPTPSESDGQERQRVRDTPGDSCSAATHAEGGRRGVRVGLNVGAPGGEVNPFGDDCAPTGGASRASTDWGGYEPAIRRWESMTGRVAPAPTAADGKKGGHRLSAHFVEWMMGLPDGWVTAPEIGLTRNEQLKALGNGVVPQQAALALRTLLGAS